MFKVVELFAGVEKQSFPMSFLLCVINFSMHFLFTSCSYILFTSYSFLYIHVLLIFIHFFSFPFTWKSYLKQLPKSPSQKIKNAFFLLPIYHLLYIEKLLCISSPKSIGKLGSPTNPQKVLKTGVINNAWGLDGYPFPIHFFFISYSFPIQFLFISYSFLFVSYSVLMFFLFNSNHVPFISKSFPIHSRSFPNYSFSFLFHFQSFSKT